MQCSANTTKANSRIICVGFRGINITEIMTICYCRITHNPEQSANSSTHFEHQVFPCHVKRINAVCHNGIFTVSDNHAQASRNTRKIKLRHDHAVTFNGDVFYASANDMSEQTHVSSAIAVFKLQICYNMSIAVKISTETSCLKTVPVLCYRFPDKSIVSAQIKVNSKKKAGVHVHIMIGIIIIMQFVGFNRQIRQLLCVFDKIRVVLCTAAFRPRLGRAVPD